MRERILDAARELLNEDGYEAFSMRKLGERLDYTPSAIYRHFENKAALLQALVGADCAAFSAAADVQEVEDPVERIRLGAEACVEFGLAHPDRYRLLFVAPSGGGDAPLSVAPSVPVGDPSLDRYAALRQAVTEALETGRFRRDVGDVELITQALWATVHGVVSLRLIRGRQPWVDWRPAKETARTLVDAVLRGLAPESERPVATPDARRSTEGAGGPGAR